MDLWKNLKMLETPELKRSDFMIKNAYLYAKTEVLAHLRRRCQGMIRKQEILLMK